MDIARFYQLLKDSPGDYLVIMDVKYRFEDTFTRIYECVSVDENGDFCWLNDWNEGQSDIFVLCYDTIDNVGKLLLDHYIGRELER